MSGPRAYAGGRAGPPWRRPLLVATFFVLLIALLASKIGGGSNDPVSPAAGVADAAAPAADPKTVQIPAIGVSAPVIPLGLDANGALEAPRDYDVTGWYTGGPEPGERGPAVIAGHVDSRSGPAVFYKLRELRRGDEIRVDRADGSSVAFVVDNLEQVPKNGFPTRRVYGPTREATLRLVTCSGDFNSATGHYTDNTIVYATQH